MVRTNNPEEQLAAFLAKYTPEIAARAEAARNEMRKLYPMALELVYDNYNALAIGYSPSERASDAVFSIALYPRWVSLFFLQARGLPDPDRLLKGSGTVARHIVLASPTMLHDAAVRDLMKEAVGRAKTPFDPRTQHQLIIKSISKAQRPRLPGGETKARTTRSKQPSARAAGAKA
jgi:hypothetical protein